MPKRGKKSGNTERRFGIRKAAEPHTFASNYISTTRYTALNFFPLALLRQFKRYANVYFLVAAILQLIPQISPLTPISAIAPLTIVIALSMLREGYEDVQRYRSDKELNRSTCEVWNGDVWVVRQWRLLTVGELVRVRNKERFPADLVLLGSADQQGAAFVMTASLDGERNLKPKFALPLTQPRFGQMPEIAGEVVCGAPTVDLYELSGAVELGGERVSLGAKQLLPRGAELANTEWVIGVAAYTGFDTKIMKNADKAKPKQSYVERLNNRLILVIIGVQFLLCLATFTGAWIWNAQNGAAYDQFIPVRSHPAVEAVMTFFTQWVLLCSMVPISLIVSLEMVKFIQAFYINKDVEMYDADEKRHAKAFSSVLNEELGQIKYIFSDKTGTLTANVMELRHCVVAGNVFGEANEAPPTKIPRPFADEKMKRLLSSDERGAQLNVEIAGGIRLKDTAAAAELFVLTMALCQECVIDAADGTTYLGPSPDEIALVDSARALGYAFISSTNSGKVIEIRGERREFEVLQAFEFTSARKRASVLVRYNGKLLLLSKGADATILERLADDQPFLEHTKEMLERYSKVGLRTLCVAARVIVESEWKALKNEMAAWRGQSDEATKIETLADGRIERGMTLLGCTAVEDRLQDEVPSVIADCIAADIRVWMLTGDKLETAENIAYSCRLLQPGFQKLYLVRSDDLESQLDELVGELRDEGRHGLVVEGRALLAIAADPAIARRYVVELFDRVDAVVCCRMSPKQKGDVVRLVKNNLKGRILAVGDGANDVNMIQEAHIGVGLYGREGMNAVQASDYALPNFKALWRLLFVHGRWSYLRIADMILYFYYKNIVFAFPQWFFSFYNAFSGQSFYDDYYITFYNLIFTSFPVIVRAISDSDIDYRNVARECEDGGAGGNTGMLRKYYAHLYYVGQLNLVFNLRNLLYWKAVGLVTAAAVFWVPASILTSNITNANGRVYDLWLLSITVYTCVIFVVDAKICAFTTRLNWLFVFAVLVLSIGLYIAYLFAANVVSVFRVYRALGAVLETPHFYLSVFLLVGFGFIIDLLYLIYRREVRTPLAQMFRSLEEKFHRREKETAYELLVTQVKNSLFEPRRKDSERSPSPRSFRSPARNPLMVEQFPLYRPSVYLTQQPYTSESARLPRSESRASLRGRGPAIVVSRSAAARGENPFWQSP